MAEGGERRMLFDIRGRRRHVIRVVYAILALLMGASLFLVVGPFNIADLLGTGGTTSASKVLDEQAERIEGRLRREPDNEALLLSLTRTRIAAGNAQTETNPETGVTVLTPEGRVEMNRATEAWERYVKQTDSPDPSPALLVAGAYFNLAESSTSLEDIVSSINGAASAQRIAAKARPNLGSLSTLAIYEYYAGNLAAADKVSKKAAGMAGTKSEAKEIEKQLDEYRKRGVAFQKQKKEINKVEGERGKERLQNPFGGLGNTGSLGE